MLTATVPHEVVAPLVHHDSPVKAWREHLNLGQQEAADKIGVTQPIYAGYLALNTSSWIYSDANSVNQGG